jgi:predicted MFS family arabinose efflux permease
MSERAPLSGGLMALLAACIAVIAAALHYQTPILPELGRTFGLGAAEVGLIAAASFGGFFLGNLLLLPLGDVMDKQRLTLFKLAGLLAMQLLLGLAWSFPVLIAASFLTGVCSSVSQDIVALVSDLAAPGERGKAVGTVLSGLFMGILFGRIGGGWIADTAGWRWIYALSAALLAAALVALWIRLPRSPPRTAMPYGALMRSLASLYLGRADVRRASLTQFCLGIGYGGFWATLAPMLAARHGLGPAAAGMMALPGSAGLFIARPAGRLMDRHGAQPVVLTGAALVLAAYATFGAAVFTLAALVAGAILLDCGLRAALVANQAMVTGADANSRSRANSLLATHVWAGNAVGALAASSAFAAVGWIGVCAVGAIGAACALALQSVKGSR